ncbi:diphosphate--fructose-6-phosphate 1-phosphotransferase [Youngiibacter fragilis]|uniref:Pyrophosphate--fructose 6-phosphate 1-phosphotransferase n=1 Tax=Youngiibacter fragilis 232.1 TaxID=994573 RepID=V7IA55_9CLOT|nr:diphosphate--fructose-6-phosphate 1-phosphotransferase [Youngiibacter fragilis]ETA82176.1 6-phosphofructokinase [Youngiibacter fragilis 232.1]
MGGNLLVVHGGGPTAVINSTLYGVIMEAKANEEIDTIYGAIGGMEGIIRENFREIGNVPDDKLELLLTTPGTAIGSSRYAVSDEEYQRLPEIFRRHGIGYVLFNGGNGTMDTCGRVHRACIETGIKVVGIPKTIDNDISAIDHAPGFGSAARYIAESVAEAAQDVRSLPIHVSVIETMGRNAGWITAASAAARKHPGDAPHIILVPERPFDEEKFLAEVKRLHEKIGGVVVAVSEGLNDKDGKSIVPPIFKTGRSVYFGDVSAHLAGLIIRKLGIKARNEKPGLLGRSSMALVSGTDRQEAILVGREAVKAAVSGVSGVMVGIRRIAGEAYGIETPLIPIDKVMLHEMKLPDRYIAENGMDVTEEFLDWLRPIIGDEIPEYVSFRD